jgi:arginase
VSGGTPDGAPSRRCGGGSAPTVAATSGTYHLAVSTISLLGFPSSAGSYAAGQDQAPAALRSSGLVDALTTTGLEVRDHGDLPAQVWRPDRQNPRAQNIGDVVAGLQQLAERIAPLLESGDTLLLLGGNCTVALAVIAGLRRLEAGTPGLLYVDRNYDLNTPESTTDGALDWMGLAHALALPGAVEALVNAFGDRPLLEPFQVGWLGVQDEMTTAWERDQAARLHVRCRSSAVFASDPVAATSALLQELPAGPLAVHLDVDVLDFTDAPLAENTDGRNTGPTLESAAEGLSRAATDSRFRALSIGELNPTRCAGDPDALPRFCAALARILSASGAG